MFRDQSATTIARARKNNRSGACSKPAQPSTCLAIPDNIVLDTTATRSRSTKPSINRAPAPNEASVLTDFFANNFTDHHPPASRENLFWIPQDFDVLLSDRDVKLSIQCTGAMALACLHNSPSYTIKAQRFYCSALSNMRESCLQPATRASILSILFLSFFEVLAAADTDKSFRQAWRTHLGGAGHLFTAWRGHLAHTEFGGRVYRQTRSQVIHHALLTCAPVAEDFAFPICMMAGMSPLPHFDQADQLLMRLANLQARCNTPPISSMPEDLLLELRTLDRDLSAWETTLPLSWAFQKRPSGRQSGLWWDARHDIYSAGFIAHARNKIRAAQLLLHDLILTLTKTLPSPLRVLPQSHESFLSEAADNPMAAATDPSIKVQTLITDICATIPLYYRPLCAATPTSPQNPVPLLGTSFWFLWVLEVVGAMSASPLKLNAWVLACLGRMYETTGMRQARLVAKRLVDGQRGLMAT
ncbi:hypothetical protein LTR62_006114 [Meristemomyces frigidus]|uniref:Transcription factor domain-containing protein n=1 Tax=Meristemomyces frigidus TaxID=1508187 RepID=A0AAN7TCW9_9PEZI|nr:hypothetical protein LTR62_006114 [Meristemomyces frigidus]